MRNGSAYERPTSALPTAATGCSSSSTLPTPRATRGGSGTETVQMFPTPRASDGAKGSPNQHGRNMEAQHPTLCNLLPTPTTRDHKGRNQRDDETCLPGAVEKLLPTPVVTDARGALNATCGRNKPNPSNHSGETLTDALRMLPTPQTRDAARGPTSQTETYRPSGAYRQVGLHEQLTRLLPTPTASDNPGAGGKHNSDGHASSLTGTLKPLPSSAPNCSPGGPGSDSTTTVPCSEPGQPPSDSSGASTRRPSSGGPASSGEEPPGLW